MCVPHGQAPGESGPADPGLAETGGHDARSLAYVVLAVIISIIIIIIIIIRLLRSLSLSLSLSFSLSPSLPTSLPPYFPPSLPLCRAPVDAPEMPSLRPLFKSSIMMLRCCGLALSHFNVEIKVSNILQGPSLATRRVVSLRLGVALLRLHMASFQKFNLGKWAQPLGDFNIQRACLSENTQ